MRDGHNGGTHTHIEIEREGWRLLEREGGKTHTHTYRDRERWKYKGREGQ